MAKQNWLGMPLTQNSTIPLSGKAVLGEAYLLVRSPFHAVVAMNIDDITEAVRLAEEDWKKRSGSTPS